MNTNILRILALLMFTGALFFGWYGYQARKTQEKPLIPSPVVQRSAQVLLVRNVIAGERLNESDLRIEQVSQFNASGFSSTAQVTGNIINQDLAANTVLLSSSIQKLGPAARLLKSDERAVAVKIDEVSGVGGYIKPGDYVDVLLFANDDRDMKRKSISQIVLSNLRVISFGEVIQEVNKTSGTSVPTPIEGGVNQIQSNREDKPNTTTRSAVLAVKEGEATRLMLAASIGQLRLALRGEELLPNSLPLDAQLNNKSTVVASISNIGKNSEEINISKYEQKVAVLAKKYESHYIQNDELLKEPIERFQKTTFNSDKTNIVKSKKIIKNIQPIRIIVHSGDKTESISVKNVAVKDVK